MTELKATGLVDAEIGNEHTISKIALKAEFNWFLTNQFADLQQRKENYPPSRGTNTATNTTTSISL